MMMMPPFRAFIVLLLIVLLPAAIATLAAGGANTSAVITNVTFDPNPVNTGKFPLTIHATFVATLNIDNTAAHTPPPAFLDSIVEVCPPHPYEDRCKVFNAGHFNRTAGVYTASAKIPTDFAWWQTPPGDFTLGKYTVDLALCDGLCVKGFKKPNILAETTSSFEVVQG